MSTQVARPTSIYFLQLPLKILLFALVSFALCRSALLLSYPDYFTDMSVVSAIKAFWIGLRFDIAITALVMAPIFILILLPLKQIHNRYVLTLLGWLSWLMLLFLIGLYIGDVAYFGEVKRHIGHELLLLDTDYHVLLDIAFGSRLPLTLFIISLMVFSAWLWQRWLLRPIQSSTVRLPYTIWQKLLIYVLLVILFVWFGRGMVLKSKPIDTLDAFRDARPELANLALNGAFVILKDATRDAEKPLKILSDETFSGLNQAFLPLDPEPFEWHAPANQSNGRNIVFILLESWSYKYIDGLAGSNYNATPFMDSLVAKSQVWDNFYAAGQRSINGIQAVLTSVPVMPNQPALGYGLELNNMSRLGHIFKNAGYQTLMVQSSNRRSFHLDGIAESLGFEHYYGKEDIPLVKDYPQATPSYGWDHDTLTFTHAKLAELDQSEKPFFSFIFTGTTHEPFANPGAEFLIYPHDNASEQGFLNTLRYSDWSLQQFFEQSAKQPWYKNTTFVITADHVLRAESENLPGQFHIPFIVYTPDTSLPATRHQKIASQYDVLPSLVDLAGLNGPVYSFGESLFDRQQTQFPYAKINKGNMLGLIAASGNALFSEQGLVDINAKQPGKLQRKLKHLQWRLQLADKRLRINQWFKKPKPEESQLSQLNR
ncbi:MAG: sulfatase-like hydrolase/transferase [Methylophaga sp.]|nr:sulfatase-like hydrolase/transferase [Methylophaga sp.]